MEPGSSATPKSEHEENTATPELVSTMKAHSSTETNSRLIHMLKLREIIGLGRNVEVGLTSIRDNEGARKKGRRVGRGLGCSKGKTCGRGMNGQKSRSGGGVRPGFEGGQTPLYKRVQKYGFLNGAHRETYVEVNLGKIQLWIDSGRLPSQGEINMKDLREAAVVPKLSKRSMAGIKLLADGADLFRAPVTLVVSKTSAAARQAVERAGGAVQTVFYHRLAIQRALRKSENPLPPPQPFLPSVGRLPPKSRRAEFFEKYAAEHTLPQ